MQLTTLKTQTDEDILMPTQNSVFNKKQSDGRRFTEASQTMKHSFQLHVRGEKAFVFPDTLFFQVTCEKWHSVNVPGDRKKKSKRK